MSKRAPEVAGRHGRALQVPARPAGAPRGPPGRLARLRALPQGEVTGVSLDRRRPVVGVGVLGRAHLRQSLPGQRAVPGGGVHVEVHVAAGRVGVAPVDQPLDQRDHVRDVARRARFHVGQAAAEQPVGVGEGARVPLGQRPPGNALGGGGAQDLVIDVGDVPAVGHRVAGGLQPAHQDVEADRRAQMPQMRRPLDRSAAHVDARPPRRNRLELANCPRYGVVQAERHPA